MYEDYMDNLFERRPMPTVAPRVGEIFLYTVNRGDNTFSIARRFNTRVDLIRGLNNLDRQMMIFPGQQLLIPVLFRNMPPIKPRPNQPMQPLPSQPTQPMQPRQSYELYF